MTDKLETSIVILGGGITAQIAAFYLKEFDPLLITDKPLTKKLYVSWYLKQNSSTERLISDLNLPSTVKQIRVGCWINNKIYTAIPKRIRTTYALKTRGMPVPDAMNRGVRSFWAFTASSLEIFESLQTRLKNVKILQESIEEIRVKERWIKTENAKILYKHAISTLPQPLFSKMADIPQGTYNFRSIGIDFRDDFLDTEEYDIVYFPELAIPWNRASKIKPHKWAIEFTLPPNDINRYSFSKVLYYGKICPPYSSDYMLMPQWGMHFIGRFAKWLGGYNTSHAIQDILSFRKSFKLGERTKHAEA